MLDAERAAAVARAHARSVAAQARSLLEGRGLPIWEDGVERRFKPMWTAPADELLATVKQRWPELGAEQQLEIVAAAEQLQRESVSATRHIDPETWMEKQQATTERNGGIPKRTAPVPAKKVAERSITPAVEQWTPATLRIFLLEQLRSDPEATGKDLWEAACKVKQPHVSAASFKAAYMPEARKALRAEAGSHDASRHERGSSAERPTQVSRIDSGTRPEDQRDLPAGASPSVAGPAPESTGERGTEATRETTGADAKASAGIGLPASAEAAPRPPARQEGAGSGEAGSGAVSEPPSGDARQITTGSGPLSSREHNGERLASPTRTLERPGSIEISRFRATQRPDGMWDVEIRAEAVDHPVMDQPAAVMWDRIVGIRGGGGHVNSLPNRTLALHMIELARAMGTRKA